MSAAAFLSDAPRTQLDALRASGQITLECARVGDLTRIVDLAETGGYRLKFPETENKDALHAVIINTGGGVAGGDRADVKVTAGSNTKLTVSSATAERIYRSIGAETEISIKLSVAPGGRLNWLPHPTILFSGARVTRSIEADVAENASLLIGEATIFGRTASGEQMGFGAFRDKWRIRRDGRLLFAEEVRLEGHLGEMMGRPAIANNGIATALLIHTGPNAEDMRESVRKSLFDCPGVHGVGAWRGMLVMRALANGLSEVQCVLHRAVQALTRAAIPRLWQF